MAAGKSDKPCTRARSSAGDGTAARALTRRATARRFRRGETAELRRPERRTKTVDVAKEFWADAPRVLPLGDSNTLGLSNAVPATDGHPR